MASVTLLRAHAQFLEQERRRLKDEHGLVVSLSEVVQGLIEMHKMRMKQLASDDPESVAWFHRYLAEDTDDRV